MITTLPYPNRELVLQAKTKLAERLMSAVNSAIPDLTVPQVMLTLTEVLEMLHGWVPDNEPEDNWSVDELEEDHDVEEKPGPGEIVAFVGKWQNALVPYCPVCDLPVWNEYDNTPFRCPHCRGWLKDDTQSPQKNDPQT